MTQQNLDFGTPSANDGENLFSAFTKIQAMFTELYGSGGSDAIGFLQAGTGAVARTVQAKLRDEVSVKDFGAVGDGVTNDLTSIRAALAAVGAAGGGTVYFPRGTYMVSDYLTVPSNTRLVGESKNSVVLRASANFTDAFVVFENVSYSGVYDIHFDGNGFSFVHPTETTTYRPGLIHIRADVATKTLFSSHITVDNCIIEDCNDNDGIGIEVDNNYITVTNCTIFDIDGTTSAVHANGINADGTDFSIFANNLIYAVDGNATGYAHPLRLHSTERCRAVGNRVVVDTNYGIIIDGRYNVVDGNQIDMVGSGTIGIQLADNSPFQCEGNLVCNNTVVAQSAHAGTGITAVATLTDENVIRGNYIRGLTTRGIDVEGCAVIGNEVQISGTTGDCIRLLGDKSVCTGNKVLGGSTGIYIDTGVGSVVSGNHIYGSNTGLLLKGATSAVVSGNSVQDCVTRSFHMWNSGGASSTGCVISGNMFIAPTSTPTNHILLSDANQAGNLFVGNRCDTNATNSLSTGANTYRSNINVDVFEPRFVTTTDSASVQVLRLEGDRATMAANDEAYLSLLLSDSGGTQTEFGRISWVGTTVTDTSEAGRLDFAVMTGGTLADELQLTGTALSPSANDGLALGTTALGFADLHFATGGVINWANGEVTITETDANTLTLAGGTLVLPASGLQVGASNPFSDSSGTLTLQNVDALDATTETTIEAAIDTLANLTSIQGRTLTLADAGANAIFGWDDTAGAYENLTKAEAQSILGLPTSTTDNTVPRFDGTGGNLQTSSVVIDDSNNVLLGGYLRVGSTSAPVNTTAGDLTCTRLSIGNASLGTEGFGLATGTMTTTAAGAANGMFVRSTLSPASNSSSEFRALSMEVQPDASGINFATMIGGFFSPRVVNAGTITTTAGIAANGFLASSTAASMGTVTTAIGGDFRGFSSFSNALTSTVTNVFGIRVQNNSNTGSGPLTITSTAGIGIADQTLGTNRTNLLIGTTTIPSGTYSIYNSSSLANYMEGNLGVGTTSATSGKLVVDQSSTTAAIPVLLLDQGDDSEDMIEFTGTVGVGNAIEAVGAKTLTTTHFIKCTITGVGNVYIPVGTIA
jgi:hypothetical protein